jgi:phosphoribosyl 1,2-cyclic phosphodiesterase
LALRFINLGSGSSGNATVVEARDGTLVSRVLIDCGLRLGELKKRLQACDLGLHDLHGVFITHEHSDHWGHALTVCRHADLPIWSSLGTQHAVAAAGTDLGELHWQVARDGMDIELGALQLTPFTVPHDAREPLQLCCSDGDRRLGVVTDLGHASAHVVAALSGVHGLLLESNHDPELLRRSAYPPFLKKRVASDLGHLSNAQAADLLRQVLHPGLGRVVAAHLSERNNTPDLVRAAWCPVLGCTADDLPVADPLVGTGWCTV